MAPLEMQSSGDPPWLAKCLPPPSVSKGQAAANWLHKLLSVFSEERHRALVELQILVDLAQPKQLSNSLGTEWLFLPSSGSSSGPECTLSSSWTYFPWYEAGHSLFQS